MLYGCEAWTLKVDQQKRVRAVQRRMLRLVLNARRKRVQLEAASQDTEDTDNEEEEEDEQLDLLEPWHEFLQRTARWTEEQLRKAGQKEWLAIWRTRQWNWARKLITDDAHKWSATAMQWQPLLHSTRPGERPQGRPRKRWEQDLVEFLVACRPHSNQTWQQLAARCDEWEELKETFVSYACRL